jgi:alpha-D-xyloside xylohydrolase
MVLYEDDGRSFDYEKGEFSRIRCEWNDSTRTLNLKADANGRWTGTTAFAVEVAGTKGTRSLTMSGGLASITL